MDKQNLNQELTRENIKNLRMKNGYTQAQFAEELGVSRSTYNGIENGKVKITTFYVEQLANFYNVPFDDIAVFASGYDEGFYQGMKAQEKISKSEYDSSSMKIHQVGKEMIDKEYVNALYPAIKAMGYQIEVIDLKLIEKEELPPKILETLDDDVIFVVKKGNKLIGLWSPQDFYQFERYITTTIKGYIKEIEDITLKMGEPELPLISKSNGKTYIFHPRKHQPFKQRENAFNMKSAEERYYAEEQLRKLQKALEVNNPMPDEEN